MGKTMLLVQKWPFFHFFFLGNISQENVLYDILKGKNIFLGVVIVATLVGNQSERSKFRLDQSESRIWPCDFYDVTNQGFNHVTP